MDFLIQMYSTSILSIITIFLGVLIDNNRVLGFGYGQSGVVQDNLRTTFVNGRKLFISAGGQPSPGQQLLFVQPQQQQPQQQQPAITVVPPQQKFLQQQQAPQIIQITTSQLPQNPQNKIVGNSANQRLPNKWKISGNGKRQKIGNYSKMSRLTAAPRTRSGANLGYYYAADNARKAEIKAAQTAAFGRDEDDEAKESKPANSGSSKASISQEDRRNVDLLDVTIGVATQSTEDLAEPPAPPPPSFTSTTNDPLLVSLFTVQPKEDSEEPKEIKKKKKKKGKNGKLSNVDKPKNGTTDNTVTKRPPYLGESVSGGEPFTEYVTPPSTGGTDEATINRYSPPMTPTEHSISTMLRCQDLSTRALLPSATTCRNTRSDKVCAYLFADVDRKTGRRDVKCNLQGMEDIAESCRKTCGICCEDINYSCEDDSNGLIDCSKQLDKCHIPKWFGVLSRFCAGSCGLCALTKCRDYDNTCRVRKALCLEESTIDYMRDNCARTCGFCFVTDLVDREEEETANIAGMLSSLAAGVAPAMRHGRPGGNGAGHGNHAQRLIERPPKMGGGSIAIQSNAGASTPECVDREPNCASSEDMCGSPIYAEYMIKFCTRTCLKCGPPGAGTSAAAAALAAAEMLRRFRSSPTVGAATLPMMEPAVATQSPASALQYVESLDSTTPAPTGQRPYGGVLELLSDGGELAPGPVSSLRFTDVPAAKSAADSVTKLLHADGAAAPSEWWQNGESLAISSANDKQTCQDRYPKCASWVADGLCTSPRFTVDDRLRLCPRSCVLCSLL